MKLGDMEIKSNKNISLINRAKSDLIFSVFEIWKCRTIRKRKIFKNKTIRTNFQRKIGCEYGQEC